eukprot:NODE_2395_length_613_cov_134.755319_g2036_i0.p2 GENE.NODE_2395_length_613_cov_134.755319_g2036_i0~~NODE_2395_length_613_cov_134.755319_g2036_i0.p2  ORF type:complete len:134 (-),score=43.02 NODE_2395_length_613_cov_134.755319_g2036_i0:211-585(-)
MGDEDGEEGGGDQDEEDAPPKKKAKGDGVDGSDPAAIMSWMRKWSFPVPSVKEGNELQTLRAALQKAKVDPDQLNRKAGELYEARQEIEQLSREVPALDRRARRGRPQASFAPRKDASGILDDE